MNDIGRKADIEAVQATEYLARNVELREALGISCDADLIARPLGMGEHNLNFRFENPDSHERYVLRINVTKQPFHENQVRYEFDALAALKASGRTPLPLFLDDSSQAPCEGAMVISFCEGDQLDFDRLAPGDLDRAAHIMADIHSVAIPQDCSLYRPSDPIRKLFEECSGRYEMYSRSGFADPEVAHRMERFIRITQRCVDEVQFDPTDGRIVNTETLASHFLLPVDRANSMDRANGADASNETPRAVGANIAASMDITVSANGTGNAASSREVDRPSHSGYFIDWERPIIGDIAEDIAFFVAPTTTFWDSEYLFPTDRFEAFVETYWRAVDGRFERGNFDERFGAFLRVATFRALTWCCRAVVQQKSGAGIHITEKAKAKVPIYLSTEFMDYLADEIFG